MLGQRKYGEDNRHLIVNDLNLEEVTVYALRNGKWEIVDEQGIIYDLDEILNNGVYSELKRFPDAEAIAAVGATTVEAAGAPVNIYLAINTGNHYSADKAKLGEVTNFKLIKNKFPNEPLTSDGRIINYRIEMVELKA